MYKRFGGGNDLESWGNLPGLLVFYGNLAGLSGEKTCQV
jgi:hypothetical protein